MCGTAGVHTLARGLEGGNSRPHTTAVAARPPPRRAAPSSPAPLWPQLFETKVVVGGKENFVSVHLRISKQQKGNVKAHVRMAHGDGALAALVRKQVRHGEGRGQGACWAAGTTCVDHAMSCQARV